MNNNTFVASGTQDGGSNNKQPAKPEKASKFRKTWDKSNMNKSSASIEMSNSLMFDKNDDDRNSDKLT